MLDLVGFIKSAGYVGISAIVFAESGLLIGAVLPGDSLLFTAGFLASQGFLDIKILLVLLMLSAVIGDNVGFNLGKRYGPKIFKREDSLFFHKDHVQRSQEFFAKYGAKTLILARFVPVVRTFAPILAGVGKMPYKKFFLIDIVANSLWALGLPLLGYFLGSRVPGIDKYILPIVVLIIIISVAPTAWHILSDASRRQTLWGQIRKLFKR